MTPPVLVWLRRELRLADHPALAAACARGGPVLPVFVLDDEDGWGGAARWWLHHSLASLTEEVEARGGRLVLRRGAAEAELAALAAETGAGAVMWTRRFEPAERAREARVGQALSRMGVETRSMPGTLLFEPEAIRPYQVFTPFWKAALALPEPPPPLPAPERLIPVAAASLDLDRLELLPRITWWRGMDETWTPGETGAAARLEAFAAGPVRRYETERDRPDCAGTSMLSPHLAFGEIGPRQIWHRVAPLGAETFLKELGWREFSHHLLHRHPELAERPLKPEFAAFPWRDDPAGMEAWTRGRTGYPIVDAGMRQLWHTGWMHNRVRMIAASFLIKDLLLPWQAGEAWFGDTLVDADVAANAASWQWVAGSGADAAPFFRIFNPVLQGEKFDPQGAYVRRWIPELAGVPDRFVHRPWEAPSPPSSYPAPLVEHGLARKRALAAFAAIRNGPSSPTPGA